MENFLLFYHRVVFHCVNVPQLFYSLIYNGHMNCFQILGSINNTAMMPEDTAPGLRDPCFVAEMRQIHKVYPVLWRKRDGRPLSQGESALPLALTDFYCFSGHITLRMVLIYYAQVRFRQLQKTKERVLLIT